MEGDKNLIELSKLCCGGVAAFGEVVVEVVVGGGLLGTLKFGRSKVSHLGRKESVTPLLLLLKIRSRHEDASG